jgi:glucose-1-phosphate thymidylyltransferase
MNSVPNQVGMKGILLAGGSGTRLAPLTRAVSKQLLPVYDKPVIYYPLSTLMLAGIRDIVVISTPRDLPLIQSLLGDGSELGIRLTYCEQAKPEGIAQAFLIAEPHLKVQNTSVPVCLILGDNLFYGHDFTTALTKASMLTSGARIFACPVSDPERYGVVRLDSNQKPIEIVEKPKNPKSNLAVTGLYFYDSKVYQYAKELKPSARGELEITDINNRYLSEGTLDVTTLGRGFAWLDTGTFDSLMDASLFVKTVEARQGVKIGCPEEVAYFKKFISREQLIQLSIQNEKSGYGAYLRKIADES